MLARLTRRDLTDAQTELVMRDPNPNSSRDDRGTLAEELVAEVLGPAWKHVPDAAEWYDVIHEDRGTKVEVKSCLKTVGDDYPAKGRFRIRRDQTRSLTQSDRLGTAWYAFVLFDLDGGVISIRRAKPTTVKAWVLKRGGWNTANHSAFDYQHKLPYSVAFPEGDR